MKRWNAILEKHNYELRYKPGNRNVVADALSRIPYTEINSLTEQSHSDDSSPQNLIPCVECPINVFKNQIIIESGDSDSYEFKITFPTFHRHIIKLGNLSEQKLMSTLKKYLNPSVVNGIKTEERIMGIIQEFYSDNFLQYKVRYTQKLVDDVTSESDQEQLIVNTHNRAHRNAKENKEQLLEKYFFPSMNAKIIKITKKCSVCKENKYERHPNKVEINETPIPQYPGHIVHVDIFTTDKSLVLTAIDKLTKYAQTKILNSKSAEDIRGPLRELLFVYGVPKLIVIDNEKALHSASITFMMKNELNIEVYTTPPYRSEINGQVERFHSTLNEILRCLKQKNVHRNFQELVEQAVMEYNYSIHSVTNKRPVDLFFGRTVSFNPDNYNRNRRENIEKITAKQIQDIEYHNKKRSKIKNYTPGQIIYVKQNKRIGTKLTKRFRKETVEENRNTTIKTKSGKLVHKSNIRN